MGERTLRDECIDDAFGFLVDDDLEAFAIAAKIDGEFEAMSFTPTDEAGEIDPEVAPCEIPRNELLGKLLADFSLVFLHPPEELAGVAAHVATDHFGAEPPEGTVEEVKNRVIEEAGEEAWNDLVAEVKSDDEATLPAP